MTTTAAQNIIDYIANYKPDRGMNAVPGMPISHLPIEEYPLVRRLVADGVLTLIEVTKPSNVDPSKSMTYAYLTVAKS